MINVGEGALKKRFFAKEGRKRTFLIIFLLAVLGVVLFFVIRENFSLKKIYSAKDFDVVTVKSPIDFNNNGTDDYTDILLGARADAENEPTYNGKYWPGGYPPDNVGVCTDVIWRAFKNAGYSLKNMVDNDIKENIALYPRTEGVRDSNIDFRRVPNLNVFFSRFAVSLTTDAKKIEQWQPGDIVVYGATHIAIVSDKRNHSGQPYIIHNGGQSNREEDALTRNEITAHYRFDASLVDKRKLIAFEEK